MNNRKNEAVSLTEKPMRITRIVSVILNGVVLNKLATMNGNDVNAMAETLMLNLSDTIQRNISVHEMPIVHHTLRSEIGRRIQLPLAG